MPSPRKTLSLIIKILISGVFITLVLVKINPKDLVSNLSNLNLMVLILIGLIPLVQLSIITLVQIRLFSIFGLPLGFNMAYRHNFISSIFLFIIPGFFAPDVYLTLYYGNNFKNYPKVISGLFLNRLLGFAIFCLFAIVGLTFLDKRFLEGINLDLQRSVVYVFLFLLLGLMVLGLAYIFRKKLVGYYRKLKGHFKEVKNELSNNLSGIVYIVGLKILRYMVGLAVRLYFAYSLGIEIPLLLMAGIIMIINFLVSLPISINGIGIREIGYIGLLGMMGIKEEIGLTLSLLDFSLLLSTAFIGFVFYTFTHLRKSS